MLHRVPDPWRQADDAARAKTYTHDNMWDVMCLWEEIVDDMDGPWKDMWEANGTMELRSMVITLVEPCAIGFAMRQKLGHEESFDWEWVPTFLREWVDWSGAYPIVIGKHEEKSDAAV